MGQGKRAPTFPLGKVTIDGTPTFSGTVTLAAGTAAYGKLSANAGVNIGTVDVALATTMFTVAEVTEDTTATPLASHGGLKFGIIVSNTDAADTLFLGDSSVTATRYLIKIGPGENSGWIPVENSNVLFAIGSAASTTFTYGGM